MLGFVLVGDKIKSGCAAFSEDASGNCKQFPTSIKSQCKNIMQLAL